MRSRSRTGCSAASPKPRTWSRRPSCAYTGRSRRAPASTRLARTSATVTTRLALDQLKSARVRRETYVGEWLPEPIVTDEGADPERHAEVADMVSYAFLALLERLSPEQRAVLLLRDVFEYEYPEIASIVGTSPENARQLASRARRQRDGAAAALRGVS